MFRFACLALVSVASIGLAAPSFPGGVLDSTGRTAYLASEIGIDAIDLARGQVLWQSREAHVPILVEGDRLYALAVYKTNKLSVIAFDLARTADRVFRTEVTGFPRWVATLPTATQSFRFGWRRQKNTLFLDWKAEAFVERGPTKHASGQVQIDLDEGRVRSSPIVLHPPQPDAQPARQLEKLAVRSQATVSGQLLAAVLEELPGSTPRDRRQRLVLRGWEVRSGKEIASRELLRGTRPIVLADLDRKHLWLRDAGENSLVWSVVSILDGHLVTRVPVVPGTQVATIVGSRAYCLTVAPAPGELDGSPRRALMLHALDLETGKAVWKRSLGAVPRW
jgi:hypothetical protein